MSASLGRRVGLVSEGRVDGWIWISILALAVAVGVLSARLLLALERALAHRARQRRFERGRELEREARRVLSRAGFTVEGRSVQRTVHLLVDGAPQTYRVEADYLVSDLRGRLYVAEVKSGAKAPDPSYTPTRRQLLEYDRVFTEAEGLLLIDMEQERVHEIAWARA